MRTLLSIAFVLLLGCGSTTRHMPSTEDAGTTPAECTALLCDGGCFDSSSDRKNCGACGHVCSGDCLQGQCVCPLETTQCGEDCTDLTADPKHCGTCDHVCPTDAVCALATCVCIQGETMCAEGCIDTQDNRLHCGSCDIACESGFWCYQGVCQ